MELSIDSTMEEVMRLLPGARRALFAKHHIGGCQSCAFSGTETLAELSQRSELDPNEVLTHLLDSHHHDQKLWMPPTRARDEGNFLFVDIRTREEHEAVAIPKSEFFTQDLQQKLFSGNPETRILLYDHRGTHVLDQVAWFRGHGLNNTWALLGGIDAWSRDVDPTIQRYQLEFED